MRDSVMDRAWRLETTTDNIKNNNGTIVTMERGGLLVY
jgi:hypothetical protein